ncbi:hypothetical protein E4T56_gene6305, partial [Termitomyces sp. T112]
LAGEEGCKPPAALLRLPPGEAAALIDRADMVRIDCGAAREEAQRAQRDVIGGGLVEADIEADRYPGEDGDDDQSHQQRQQITPDRTDALGRIDAADGTGGIIADAERRGE